MLVINDVFKSYAIGSDRMISGLQALSDQAKKMGAFPPYNIVKLAENKYKIELAVAGFDMGDIEIEVDQSTLKISSAGHKSTSDFIHQGFTYKGFARSFQLLDDVRVQSAEMANGILNIFLDHIVPEEKKPKKIDITAPKAADVHPTLLHEDCSM